MNSRVFKLLGAAFALLLGTTWLFAADPAAAKSELLRADESFCALAAREGVRAAFTAFAAPDCTFLDTEPFELRGSAAVDARFRNWKDGTLTWKPAFADIASGDGNLGYTWGTWRFESKETGREARHATGKYVTIWKRQPDGTWKYVLDTGVTDPAPRSTAPSPPKP